METQALYSMEPMSTAVVDLIKEARLNRLVPIITDARPMTMVPVPMEMSKNRCCWHSTAPARLTNALAIISPMIFTPP